MIFLFLDLFVSLVSCGIHVTLVVATYLIFCPIFCESFLCSSIDPLIGDEGLLLIISEPLSCTFGTGGYLNVAIVIEVGVPSKLKCLEVRFFFPGDEGGGAFRFEMLGDILRLWSDVRHGKFPFQLP